MFPLPRPATKAGNTDEMDGMDEHGKPWFGPRAMFNATSRHEGPFHPWLPVFIRVPAFDFMRHRACVQKTRRHAAGELQGGRSRVAPGAAARRRAERQVVGRLPRPGALRPGGAGRGLEPVARRRRGALPPGAHPGAVGALAALPHRRRQRRRLARAPRRGRDQLQLQHRPRRALGGGLVGPATSRPHACRCRPSSPPTISSCA
jgi:hypothetical protein